MHLRIQPAGTRAATSWLLAILGAGALPAQDSRPASTSRPAPTEARKEEASALLEAAVTLLRQGYRAVGDDRRRITLEALEKLRQVTKDYADTKSAPPARFNTALALSDLLNQPEDAIAELERLIASDADDKDDTGELMRPFRNYRFHAWRVIADCQVARRDLGRALVACCRARVAFVTHCGTCQAGMERGNRTQLQELVAKLAPGLDAATVAALHEAHAEPEALLLHLAGALQDPAHAAAVTVLGALVAEFPASEEAKAARAQLAAPTSRPASRKK